MWEVRLTFRFWLTWLLMPTPSDEIEGKEADVRWKRDTDFGAKLGAMLKS